MRLATDIGGTFTDLVYLDDATGEIGLAKASSTPPAFGDGIMDAHREIGHRPRRRSSTSCMARRSSSTP